jgi:acyl-coenzyme A synthetase/AMP-(fatty) acid ligase
MASTEANVELTVDEAKRRSLADDPGLGAGNFLTAALAATPDPKAEILLLERKCRPFFGGEFDSFSLSSLKLAADTYAAWYLASGVRPKDVVAVYLGDGVEYLLHYVALTSLGAIPALTNGNMPADVAARHFRRIGAVGLFLDPPHKEALSQHLKRSDGYRFVVTEADLSADALPALPAWYPFEHAYGDPIMIAHSSGTTGVPKAVVLQHGPFFHGVRYRLRVPSTGGPERILSALPHSHNCAMAYLMLALLCGNRVYVSSDHTGNNLAKRITDFKPTMVVSFPQTYVELTEVDLTNHDLRSIRFWFNGGDAAHEQHIRTLVSHGSREEGGRTVQGSIFIDGMGSSEMGFSLLRHVHLGKTDDYDRCVGAPLEWAEAAVLGDDGEILPPGVVGRLGVKAPSVTSGYWNDSALTFRSQLGGYWLTGDLAFRDAKGRFYHVDRVPDVVRTTSGPVYSLATEELLLKNFQSFADCSIIAVPTGDGFEAPLALVRIRAGASRDEAATLLAVNAVLDPKGWGRIAALRIVDADEIPLGTTGKVLKRLLRERFQDYFTASSSSKDGDASKPNGRRAAFAAADAE